MKCLIVGGSGQFGICLSQILLKKNYDISITTRKVSKTKKGVPTKYVKGAKNPSARQNEILRTRKRYKLGLLTPAEMDRISKQRAKG